MKLKILALCTLALSLINCTPRWNKDSCKQTDFSQLGYTEGSQGLNNQIESYNQACLKKKVNIDLSKYNSAYNKGILAFCSPSKAQSDGSAGSPPHKNCQMTQAYMKSYDFGLKSFCSSERGVKDGYALQPENSICNPYYAYRNGYKQGVKELCSYEKGKTDGFLGKVQHSTCVPHLAYTKGYKSGKANFCMPSNGLNLGKQGASFPSKCKSSAFRTNYNKGRVLFLTQSLSKTETSLTFEKQNYEQLRDQIQDLQFSFQRLPKNRRNPNVIEEQESIERRINILQQERNKQREVVLSVENKIQSIKSEIQSLK